MNRPLRALLTSVASFGIVLGLCGFTIQQGALQYDPNHYVNNDPEWTVLSEADVTVDEKKGEYHAAFPFDVIDLQSRPFKISGFMMPLDPSQQTLHFALVRRNSGCPFCPPNSPTEAIEVFSRSLVKYTGEEVVVQGRLTLVSSGSQGMFYRLDDARVTRSS